MHLVAELRIFVFGVSESSGIIFSQSFSGMGRAMLYGCTLCAYGSSVCRLATNLAYNESGNLGMYGYSHLCADYSVPTEN